jgi:thioredoxin 1
MATIQTITSSEFDAKVLQARGAVVLDFYQVTCAPCRALEPRLERVAQQYAGRVPVYRIDIDRDLSIADRLGVQSIPTVLVFRGGKEIESLDGLITDQQLRTAFEKAAASISKSLSPMPCERFLTLYPRCRSYAASRR